MARPSAAEAATRVLRGKGFGATQDGAVHDDQGDEQAEHLVQIVQPGIESEIDERHQRRDQDDEDRDAHLRTDQRADRRHQNIGRDQHRRGRQPHAEAVGAAGGDGHRRTEGEHLGEDDVLQPEAVLQGLNELFHGLCLPAGFPRGARRRNRVHP
jgi:hypothetical protein